MLTDHSPVPTNPSLVTISTNSQEQAGNHEEDTLAAGMNGGGFDGVQCHGGQGSGDSYTHHMPAQENSVVDLGLLAERLLPTAEVVECIQRWFTEDGLSQGDDCADYSDYSD